MICWTMGSGPVQVQFLGPSPAELGLLLSVSIC